MKIKKEKYWNSQTVKRVFGEGDGMKKLLFNPGPTNVSERVRNAIKTEDICHREKEFGEVVLRVNKNLLKLLNGEGTHECVMFVASGTGVNEAMISSIQGKVLLIKNGVYSDRLEQTLERYDIPTSVYVVEPYDEIDFNYLSKILNKDKGITHIMVVLHETTTGVLLPLRRIGELAKKHGKVLMVDGISAIGGHPFDLKKDNVAFVTVTANKCIQGFPGVSFVLVRKQELVQLENKSRSFYFDLWAEWKSQQTGILRFTAAVQVIYAADEAIKEFLEEGYDNRVERYKKLSKQMREGLKKLGFKFFMISNEELQSNIITAIKIPEWMDYQRVHDKLKKRGITIYSGVKLIDDGSFRIATLGSITSEDIKRFLKDFKEVLEDEKKWK
jgi:2-aminoethylphosphonate-pyruvate transaminase